MAKDVSTLATEYESFWSDFFAFLPLSLRWHYYVFFAIFQTLRTSNVQVLQ